MKISSAMLLAFLLFPAPGHAAGLESVQLPVENEVIRLRSFQPGQDKLETLLELYKDRSVRSDYRKRLFKGSLNGFAEFLSSGHTGTTITGSRFYRLPLLIEDKASGQFVGSLDVFQHENYLGLGYVVAARHRRKGFASRAVKLAVKSFSSLNLEFFWSYTSPKNKPSQKVLENAGFVRLAEDDEPLICQYILQNPRDR